MNKRFIKRLCVSSLLGLFTLPLISSCKSESSDGTIYVHVLNAEDYIEYSLLDSFSEYIYERDGKNVSIIYDTYDTNETMYNTLKTGKTTYDLICASDYMVQRLGNEDLLNRFDYDNLIHYEAFVNPLLYNEDSDNLGKLNIMEVNNSEGSFTLDEYAIGYMWGTLGILYNPDYILSYNSSLFDTHEDYKNLSYEERYQKIIDTFNGENGYSFLWDELLKGTQSIKDSMRDSYALGNFEVFKDYYLNTNDDYFARNEKFNDSSDETIELIKNRLIDLKTNIFGFEVDSGKNDIVTRKIGVNLAWSGDAVNSINRGFYADDDWSIERDDPIDLYYAIPSLGANLWMDCWANPKHEDNEAYLKSEEYKYAMEFLDYMSAPENAILNVDYNGYTSFTSSNNVSSIDDEDMATAMLAYVLYCYDLSDGDADEDLESYETYDLTSFFEFTEDVTIDLSYVSGEIFEDEEIDDRTFTFEYDEELGRCPIIIRTDLSSFEGRLLKAAFPRSEEIDSLYVMSDYGEQNDKIVQMWEDVKVNPLPTWIVVTLIVFIVIVLTYLGSYRLIRRYKLKKRKQLREEANRS